MDGPPEWSWAADMRWPTFAALSTTPVSEEEDDVEDEELLIEGEDEAIRDAWATVEGLLLHEPAKDLPLHVELQEDEVGQHIADWQCSLECSSTDEGVCAFRVTGIEHGRPSDRRPLLEGGSTPRKAATVSTA